jgi:two-component system, cell cycle response regulator DivK
VTRRVLIVDDDKDSSYIMCYLFQVAGYEAFSARGGSEALEMCARQRPDVVVLDLNMRPMGGLEVARLMEADSELSRIPRIAATAVAMGGDRERVLEAGFDGYISKPIEPERFVRQVEEFLSASSRSGRDSNSSRA